MMLSKVLETSIILPKTLYGETCPQRNQTRQISTNEGVDGKCHQLFYWSLTLKRPTIHGLKMINSVDYFVNHIIPVGPNFILPESVKNIACVG